MVTEAEALKMIMQARGISKKEGVEPWSEAYKQAAVEAGILSADTQVSNKPAKRSMVIVSADSAVAKTTGETATTDSETATDSEEDDLGGLFGDLFGDEGTDMGTVSTSSESTSSGTTTSSGSTSTGSTSVKAGYLEVSLSPSTPAGADLPNTAEGVAVASFDLTAGASDVSVSSIKLTRKGLGASDAVSDVALLLMGLEFQKLKLSALQMILLK